jgi:hypothetical protein
MNLEYEGYLKSKEWKALCKAVKERCNNICERCNNHLVDDVHHLTYVRKYEERLEDLQGLCAGCHEFLHRKSGIDPKERSIHVKVTGKIIQYLDVKTRKFRKFKIAKLCGSSSKITWESRVIGSYRMAGAVGVEPGRYVVPMNVFLDDTGRPVFDTTRWKAFKETYHRRRWQETNRPIPDPFVKEEYARAKERQKSEKEVLNDHPDRFTSFQDNIPTTPKEVIKLFKKFPSIVLYGREYRILSAHTTKTIGVVLDLERDTNTGWITTKIPFADEQLAAGKILLDHERKIWVVKNE